MVCFWLSVETPVNKRQHFCFDEMYKLEKSKEDTSVHWKLRSRNSSMTSEEFYAPKIIYITIAKIRFTVLYYLWQLLKWMLFA